MNKIVIRIVLFVNFLGLISSFKLWEKSGNSSKLSEENLVECDLKSHFVKLSESRQKLCKVECYTKLNNPGVCQTHTLKPCKTLPSTDEHIKCPNRDQNSPYPLICCPFKREKPQNSGEKPNSVKPITKPEECGKRPDIQAIVGGIDAQPNTWPWVVSIYEKSNPKSPPRFICGGAIINEKYILSAAHCFVRSTGQKPPANRFLVKVGAHRLSDKNIKLLEISEIIVHKKYNTVQHYYDISLVRMKSKIEFLPTVGPICLPRSSRFAKESFVGKTSTIVGWGATRFGGSTSDGLKEANVNIIDNKECNRNYSQISGHETAFPQGINEQHLCAGVRTGGKDSCQGDSGGPLVVEIDDRWYQLGVVSFGYKCAEPGFPGIYAKVKYFLDWIESQIR